MDIKDSIMSMYGIHEATNNTGLTHRDAFKHVHGQRTASPSTQEFLRFHGVKGSTPTPPVDTVLQSRRRSSTILAPDDIKWCDMNTLGVVNAVDKTKHVRPTSVTNEYVRHAGAPRQNKRNESDEFMNHIDECINSAG